MSKYIDLELALNELLRLYEEDVDAYGVEIPETFDYSRAREALLNLPTIEVSEDAISREWLINRFKDIVKHYEMRIRRAKRYGKKTTYDTSEQIGYWKDEIADYKFFIREIENAPSVVLSRAEGEWKLVDHLWECDCCQYRQNKSKPTNYCPNCGAKMKGADE